MLRPMRVAPPISEKIALEKIAELIGYEKLCEIGEEYLRDGDTPEFMQKLAAIMSQNANLLEQQANSVEWVVF